MAKELFFSDVKSFGSLSCIQPNDDYAQYFGFTPDEVQQLLTQAGLQDQIDTDEYLV